MIAHLLAGGVAIAAAASPTVTPIEAAPLAQVRVVAGSVAIIDLECETCHPIGWLYEGDVVGIIGIGGNDKEWRVTIGRGWLHCDKPDNPAAVSYEIVTTSGNIVIERCADYATS